ELPRFDNSFFDIVGPVPWLGLAPAQPGPPARPARRGRQTPRYGLQTRRAVNAEEKPVGATVPAVEARAFRQVGVTTQEHVRKAAVATDAHDPIDGRRRALVRGPVAWEMRQS